MPQRDGLLPWRRSLENVTVGPEVMGRRCRREQARALLPLWPEGFERSYPHELSGGCASGRRSCAHCCVNSRLCCSMSPRRTGRLTRRTMRDWLLHIWERFQRTMLFVTHDVDEAVLSRPTIS